MVSPTLAGLAWIGVGIGVGRDVATCVGVKEFKLEALFDGTLVDEESPGLELFFKFIPNAIPKTKVMVRIIADPIINPIFFLECFLFLICGGIGCISCGDKGCDGGCCH